MLLELHAGAAGSARERVGDVAIRLPELGQEIAGAGGMDARCARGEGLPAVRHRGKRPVVDGNERRGVLGDVARLRDHHRHRLADKGDLVLGKDERRYIGRELRRTKLERKPFLCEQRRQIGEREHGMHAGILLRGPDVDGADLGMGMRAAHECRLEHVGKAQIGDEAAGTREQGAIFKPLDGVADKTGCCHGLHASLTVAPGRPALRARAHEWDPVLREKEQVGSVRAGEGCCGRSVTTLILILFQDCSHCSKRRCTRALLSAHHL